MDKRTDIIQQTGAERGARIRAGARRFLQTAVRELEAVQHRSGRQPDAELAGLAHRLVQLTGPDIEQPERLAEGD